jgi:putative colanic acid biosynthesis glycosyltransferase
MGEQPVRVLQINSVCGIGSTGRIATDIHNLLVEQGHESYIAYGRGFARDCESTIRIGTNYDNYSHVALTRVFDYHGFGSRKATKDFIRELEAVNPDLIHLHNIHGYYLNIEMLFDYLKRANKPVIWTLHDCWPFTGHCAYFEYAGCDKWKTSCNNCPEKKSYPASLFLDRSYENFHKKKEIFTGVKNMKIVTPSKWLANLVKESFLCEYPIEVVNNGIDLGVFKPTKSNFRKGYGIQNKFLILGVASMWDRRKGLKYFIDLSDKLEEEEVIVLVGLTEKQKKDLPKNVIGITRTNNVAELAEIYSAADVFVNPTLEDNFPTTNIEALACGTPILSFNTGGSIESIDHGINGYVVQKGNVNELLRYLSEIKTNGKDYYRQECIKSANDFYNKKIKYTEYLQIYSNMRTKISF